MNRNFSARYTALIIGLLAVALAMPAVALDRDVSESGPAAVKMGGFDRPGKLPRWRSLSGGPDPGHAVTGRHLAGEPVSRRDPTRSAGRPGR